MKHFNFLVLFCFIASGLLKYSQCLQLHDSSRTYLSFGNRHKNNFNLKNSDNAPISTVAQSHRHRHGLDTLRRPRTCLSMKKGLPTLDEDTLWRINLSLKDDPARVDVTRASIQVRFCSDRRYEPPQGRIFIEDDYNGLVKVDDAGYSGVWSLSEDKEDRKGALWVWGLFEEPKYPYLYCYLDIYDTVVNEKGEEVDIFPGKRLPKLRLNFRFDHYQDKKSGVVLLNGCMTYKISEYIKADPLGLGGLVDVGSNVSAGTVVISARVPENTNSVIE